MCVSKTHTRSASSGNNHNHKKSQRVEIARDLALQLKRLHESDSPHGMLLAFCFLACSNLHVLIGESSIPAANDAKPQDILGLGILLTETLVKKNVLEEIPAFVSVLKGEEDVVVDFALRNLLGTSIPGSLVELVCQLCASDVTLRPSAEDAWAWLDSIVEDLVKLGHADWFWQGTEDLHLARVDVVQPASPRYDPRPLVSQKII